MKKVKSSEIIEKTKQTRHPLIGYAKACTKKSIINLQGKWQGPVCVLSIEISDGKFQANGSYDAGGNLLTMMALGGQSTGLVKMNVSYSGEVIGHGITYTKHTKEEGPSLLTTDTPTKGLMIVSDDLDIITAYVEGVSSKSSYILQRVD